MTARSLPMTPPPYGKAPASTGVVTVHAPPAPEAHVTQAWAAVGALWVAVAVLCLYAWATR